MSFPPTDQSPCAILPKVFGAALRVGGRLLLAVRVVQFAPDGRLVHLLGDVDGPVLERDLHDVPVGQRDADVGARFDGA